MSQREENRYEECERQEDIEQGEESGEQAMVSLNSWMLRWVVACVALVLFKGPLGLQFGPLKIAQWYLANALLAVIVVGTWAVVMFYTYPQRGYPGSGGILLKVLMIFQVAFLVLTQLPVLAEI